MRGITQETITVEPTINATNERILEIPFGDECVLIPIQDIDINRCILKTKDSYLELLESLEKWWKHNNRLTENKYKIYVESRLNFFDNEFYLPQNDNVNSPAKVRSDVPSLINSTHLFESTNYYKSKSCLLKNIKQKRIDIEIYSEGESFSSLQRGYKKFKKSEIKSEKHFLIEKSNKDTNITNMDLENFKENTLFNHSTQENEFKSGNVFVEDKNAIENETISNNKNILYVPLEHPKLLNNTQSTGIENVTNDNILNEEIIQYETKNLTLDDIKDVSQENFLYATKKYKGFELTEKLNENTLNNNKKADIKNDQDIDSFIENKKNNYLDLLYKPSGKTTCSYNVPGKKNIQQNSEPKQNKLEEFNNSQKSNAIDNLLESLSSGSSNSYNFLDIYKKNSEKKTVVKKVTKEVNESHMFQSVDNKSKEKDNMNWWEEFGKMCVKKIGQDLFNNVGGMETDKNKFMNNNAENNNNLPSEQKKMNFKNNQISFIPDSISDPKQNSYQKNLKNMNMDSYQKSDYIISNPHDMKMNFEEQNFDDTFNKMMNSQDYDINSPVTPIKDKTATHYNKGHQHTNESMATENHEQQTNMESSGFILTCGIDNTLKRVFIGKNSRSLNFNYEVSNEVKNDSGCAILSVGLSKDNKILFLGDEEGQLKQYKFSHFSLAHDYGKVHNGGIWCMALTPSDERFLFTADSEGSINQFDIMNKILIKSYQDVHEGQIRSILFTNNTSKLFSLSADGYFTQWTFSENVITQDYSHENHEGNESAACMEVCQRDKYQFIGGDNATLRQWDVLRQKLYKDYKNISNSKSLIINIKSIPKNDYLIISTMCGEIILWNMSAEKSIRLFDTSNQSYIMSMDITEDGKYVILGDIFGGLRQWDIHNQCVSFDYGQMHNGWICKIMVRTF